MQAVSRLLCEPELAPILIEIETGRSVRFSLSEEPEPTAPETVPPTMPPETVPETAPETIPKTVPDYRAEGLSVQYACRVSPDLQKCIEAPLPLENRKTVLLYATHATESYTKNGEDYRESGAYRTENPDYNMISLATALAAQLENRGVSVLLDTTLHDAADYNSAYGHARKGVKAILEEHPEIGLILDLHRDAVETSGGQLRTLAQSEQKPCAKLMLVVGTDRSGLAHPGWQENLGVALKLQWHLEQLSLGICRPLSVRSQRFNQDLGAGALLVEIGAAGNSRTEALRAASLLAEAVAKLLN